MLSLAERQNECTFILLSEHDRPNLSAVAHTSTQSVELSPSEFQTASAERHVVSAIHLVTAAVT